MKIGASTLAGLHEELEDILDFIEDLGLEYAELVHQFPYENIDVDLLESYNLKYSIHSPFMDVNIASLQERSRINSVEQIKSSIDLANKIDAETVVVHPGLMPSLQDLLKIKYTMWQMNPLRNLEITAKTWVSMQPLKTCRHSKA